MGEAHLPPSRHRRFLLLPLLLCHFAVGGEAQSVYNVGGTLSVWGVPLPGYTFQAWSNSIFWRSNDSLSFLYDYTLGVHNVFEFPDKASFDACDGSVRNALGYDYYNLVTLLAVPPGDSYTTFYFGSTVGLDCENGMKFSVLSYTCDTCAVNSPQSPPTSTSGFSAKKKKKFPVAAVAVPVVLVLVVGAGILVFCCVCCTRRRALASLATPQASVPPSPLPTFSPIKLPDGIRNGAAPAPSAHGYGQTASPYPGATETRGSAVRMEGGTAFTYQQLCTATHDFSQACQIGKGAFGIVYRGVLTDGTVVAIKAAKHVDKAEDRAQLLNEVAVLSKMSHRNLVSLLGCCVDTEVPTLVYEFVPNGTLREHLALSRQGFPSTLDWSARLKIALQTAQALQYLHVHVAPPVIHRDVKSANILLDDGWNAKVSDFGMSKQMLDSDATHIKTMVKGTTGYLDPEYMRTGQLTDKSDVFSLGIVLLELLVASKPVDMNRPRGQQSLAHSAVPMIMDNRVLEIIDPQLSTRLTSRGMVDAINGVAKVAVACLVPDSASRPSMTQVVQMLHNIEGSNLEAQDFLERQGSNVSAFHIGRPPARPSPYPEGTLRAQYSTPSWSSDSGATFQTHPRRMGPR